MITLNISERKEIKFNVTVGGVSHRDLVGKMRIVLEGIEYGFSIKMVDNAAVVVIPPLDTFIRSEKLTEGMLLDASLDIIADGNLLVPWKDSIRIEMPVKVEATVIGISESDEKKSPVIKVENVIDEKIIVKKDDEVKSKFRSILDK